MFQLILAIWDLVPLPFLSPDWTLVRILLKPGLENFEHYFASVWPECNCVVVWMLFGIAFLWLWNENLPFQSCGHCSIFQIYDILSVALSSASSFRIWNGSCGISSHQLALFIVMLLSSHLLHTPVCLALGEWSHHRGYLGDWDLFFFFFFFKQQNLWILLCVFYFQNPNKLGVFHRPARTRILLSCNLFKFIFTNSLSTDLLQR